MVSKSAKSYIGADEKTLKKLPDEVRARAIGLTNRELEALAGDRGRKLPAWLVKRFRRQKAFELVFRQGSGKQITWQATKNGFYSKRAGKVVQAYDLRGNPIIA